MQRRCWRRYRRCVHLSSGILRTHSDESQYLDFIPQAHPRRTGALHLIVKLAHRSEQLPRSLYVEDVALSHGRYDCGGFADVYEGMLEDRAVAIKKPRMYGEDAFADKVLSAGCPVYRLGV
jgi:hypothetical protein